MKNIPDHYEKEQPLIRECYERTGHIEEKENDLNEREKTINEIETLIEECRHV